MSAEELPPAFDSLGFGHSNSEAAPDNGGHANSEAAPDTAAAAAAAEEETSAEKSAEEKSAEKSAEEKSAEKSAEEKSAEKSAEAKAPPAGEAKARDEVPLRFINAEKGDRVKAEQRYLSTLKWRKHNRIDEILDMPHPHFHTIMAKQEAYYCGKAKNGRVVYYEKPKACQIAALSSGGIHLPEMIYHFVWMTEYLWTKLDPNDNSTLVSVLDMEGVGVTDLVGDVLTFVKASSKVCQMHYPERSNKIFLINCSRMFTLVWNIVKNFLDPVTLKKISLSRNDWKKEIVQFIDKEKIPTKYGGTAEMGMATEESKEQAAYVEHINATSTVAPLGRPITTGADDV